MTDRPVLPRFNQLNRTTAIPTRSQVQPFSAMSDQISLIRDDIVLPSDLVHSGILRIVIYEHKMDGNDQIHSTLAEVNAVREANYSSCCNIADPVARRFLEVKFSLHLIPQVHLTYTRLLSDSFTDGKTSLARFAPPTHPLSSNPSTPTPGICVF